MKKENYVQIKQQLHQKYAFICFNRAILRLCFIGIYLIPINSSCQIKRELFIESKDRDVDFNINTDMIIKTINSEYMYTYEYHSFNDSSIIINMTKLIDSVKVKYDYKNRPFGPKVVGHYYDYIYKDTLFEVKFSDITTLEVRRNNHHHLVGGLPWIGMLGAIVFVTSPIQLVNYGVEMMLQQASMGLIGVGIGLLGLWLSSYKTYDLKSKWTLKTRVAIPYYER